MRTCRVYFDLNELDWHGFSSESVWGRKGIGKASIEVQNAPFFATGVSRFDRVVAEKREGDLWFLKVAKKSGHATIRVLIKRFDEVRIQAIELLDVLLEAGCSYEGAEMGAARLLSIDVPPSVEPSEVVKLLEQGAERDFWDAEVGDSGGRSGFWETD
jgi:hypothetical protein